jgi:peroxiredoxin
MEGRRIPDITFKTRVRDESIDGDNPFRWEEKNSTELFGASRVVIFSVPGAFTPVCSSEECPAYEDYYDAIKALGIDEIYCISVNDAFVMYQWGQHLNIAKVKLLPDGSGHFTRRMGMLVNKDHLGFGYRSWRYTMIADHGLIEKWFEEPGINDEGADDDPYDITAPESVITHLRKQTGLRRAAR